MFITPLYRFYSGVVAGAREALFNSVPSISISLDWYLPFFFDQKRSCTFLTDSLFHNLLQEE